MYRPPQSSENFQNPPQYVMSPPVAERASAQRTAPAAPRPVNNAAPGATYNYAVPMV